MSYAHFLDADPEYLQAVTGLKPDPTLHQTQLTIEPVTGAVITFHKRYQWNIWIRPLAGIDYFKQFHSLIVPVLWNDDVSLCLNFIFVIKMKLVNELRTNLMAYFGI